MQEGLREAWKQPCLLDWRWVVFLLLASFNIWRNWKELPTLFTFAHTSKWDMVMVQEVGKLQEDSLSYLEDQAQQLGYEAYWNLKSAAEVQAKAHRNAIAGLQVQEPGADANRVHAVGDKAARRSPTPSGGLLTLVSSQATRWLVEEKVYWCTVPMGATLLHTQPHCAHVMNVYAPLGNKPKNDRFIAKYIQPVALSGLVWCYDSRWCLEHHARGGQMVVQLWPGKGQGAHGAGTCPVRGAP